MFGEYQSTEPSRFLDEIPAELVERIAPPCSSPYQGSFSHSHYEFRTNPYGAARAAAGRSEAEPAYAYEDEDQSATGAAHRHARAPRAVRRRHGDRVEEHNDDFKVTVRFNTVGVKKLLAKYAKLEPA